MIHMGDLVAIKLRNNDFESLAVYVNSRPGWCRFCLLTGVWASKDLGFSMDISGAEALKQIKDYAESEMYDTVEYIRVVAKFLELHKLSTARPKYKGFFVEDLPVIKGNVDMDN